MRLDTILSAAAKNGVAITNRPDSYHSFILTKGVRQLEFYEQNGYVERMVLVDDVNKVDYDIYMDFDNLKKAMNYLNEADFIVKNTEDVIVNHNVERGGIEIKFSDKPSNSVIELLREKKFKWSPYHLLWWKKYNAEDFVWAKQAFYKLLEV